MTCRWIILVRGYRWLASSISVFEQILYVTALSLVVTKLTDITGILMFALGYGIGNVAGSWCEQKLSLGYAVFNIVTERSSRVYEVLRDAGFGVTMWSGEGRDTERMILLVVVPRKQTSAVIEIMKKFDEQAFVVRIDPQDINGGFFVKKRIVP